VISLYTQGCEPVPTWIDIKQPSMSFVYQAKAYEREFFLGNGDKFVSAQLLHGGWA